MQQFLYRIQPTRIEMLTVGATEEESTIVGEHFAYLKNLLDKGVVLMAGRTTSADADTFGIVVFVAESEAHAAEIVRDDPAVKFGVMRPELYPYQVALWSKAGPAEQ
jgi:uncharacterized protein YciI